MRSALRCRVCPGPDDSKPLIKEVAKAARAAEQEFAGLLADSNRMPTVAVYEGAKCGLSILAMLFLLLRYIDQLSWQHVSSHGTVLFSCFQVTDGA